MNQENIRLSQFDACAVASVHHSLPSCYFLLELAFASFYDVKFEFESVVSGSPILFDTFHQYLFHHRSTTTPSLCVSFTVNFPGHGGLVQ